MSKINGKPVRGFDNMADAGPGAFYFVEGDTPADVDAQIGFNCPCGCGSFALIGVTEGAGNNRTWTWNGDREKPTLSPSLHNMGCGWHGYLRAGVFESV